MQPRKTVLLLLAALLTGLSTAHARDLFMTERDPISPEIERMYKKGLKFLVSQQQADGAWSDNYGRQPGVVGLCVVAMLAHGEDPNFGPYATPIRKGLNFILKNQNSTNGYIGSSMYNHGFATLALAEAYGAVNDDRLGPALQKAVELLLSTQKTNAQGAWRYGPHSTDADTTVSGACLVGLLAARNAGIAVPDKAVKKALDFYRRCQSSDGGFGYTNAGGSNAPRSAIGLLVFYLAKESDNAVAKSARQYVKQAAFGGGGGHYSHYHYYNLYYMSQAVFQAHFDSWEKWNQVNVKRLKTSQLPNGSWQGSFGYSFSTSAALLSLALNYRFLPIYER